MNGRALPTIVLAEGVTIQDLARALTRSGLAISNTIAPHLFAIKPAPKRDPAAKVIDLTVWHSHEHP